MSLIANAPDRPDIDFLRKCARRAMLEAGFQPDFPAAVAEEAARAEQRLTSFPSTRDLRTLLWSSIDDDQSRDLDQIEYAEGLPDGSVRLLIGIADVDAHVAQGSETDRYASGEATSVYTGVITFPMLPPALSTERTSLLQDGERAALIVDLRILDSGAVVEREFYPAWVRNRAKLAYNSTGAWLEGRGAAPALLATVPGLEAQLRLQLELALRLRRLRKAQGALSFATTESVPVINEGGLQAIEARPHNVAQDIIESFMVAANVAIAQLLKERRSLAIRRVVKTPKRWERIQEIAQRFGVALPASPDPRGLAEFLEQRAKTDPTHFPELSLSVVKLLGPGEYIVEAPGAEQEGHFGLAVNDYTHSTAPNRRYADLVTQRLLKAVATNSPAPYTEDRLREIATHCTEREDAARKVERRMRKVLAASLLRQRIGEVFSGIITGASPKGTYVRLPGFPAEGRIVSEASGVDVGDRVNVRLASVEIEKGFIDFQLQRS
jgi:VacB/RNase II family 3'-5' exoribonuclease